MKRGWKIPGLKISREDLELIWCRAWSRGGVGNKYVGNGVTTLHRAVMARIIGRQLKRHEFVDHRNHNPLDNRRSNLRLTDMAGNQQNRSGPQRNGTSGYRGVSWDKQRGKWLAHAKVNGRKVLHTRFTNKRDAARCVRRFWAQRLKK